MFKIGDKVVYGSNGVCEITSISTLESSAQKDRLYYILHNLVTGGTAYVPTDSEVYLCAIMNKTEAQKLISEIPNVPFEHLSEINPKEAQKCYKDILLSHDRLKIIGLIKFLKFTELRKKSQKKKLSIIEERYLSQALIVIGSELGASLELSKEKVEEMVQKALGN